MKQAVASAIRNPLSLKRVVDSDRINLCPTQSSDAPSCRCRAVAAEAAWCCCLFHEAHMDDKPFEEGEGEAKRSGAKLHWCQDVGGWTRTSCPLP